MNARIRDNLIVAHDRGRGLRCGGCRSKTSRTVPILLEGGSGAGTDKHHAFWPMCDLCTEAAFEAHAAIARSKNKRRKS